MTDFAHLSAGDFHKAREASRPGSVRLAVWLSLVISGATILRAIYDAATTWGNPWASLPQDVQQRLEDQGAKAWFSGAAVMALVAVVAVAVIAALLARALWRSADAGARLGLTVYCVIGVIGLVRTAEDFHGGLSWLDLALNIAALGVLVELWLPSTSRWLRRFDEG